MNNHSAPSVRLHPPGLVCSLLASVPCHGLAPAVCLPSTFFLGMARRCFVSVWLYLSVSVSFRLPTLVFPSSSLSPSFSSSLPRWPRHPNQMNKQIMWEKRENKKKNGKGCSAIRGIRGEVICLTLFWRHDWMFTLLTVWYFSYSPFQYSLLPIFIRLTAALFSL